jgi:hypothetical protein
MVENAFSPEMVDRIIAESKVPSGGAYTAVGTYDGAEIAALLSALCRATQTPAAILLNTFGRHLFGRFVVLFPKFFDGYHSTFDFLPRVNDYIHVEVRKLYPDAVLPDITAERIDPDTMNVTYRSRQCLASLARGLIEGCAAHFGEAISIVEADNHNSAGAMVDFTLRRLKA